MRRNARSLPITLLLNLFLLRLVAKRVVHGLEGLLKVVSDNRSSYSHLLAFWIYRFSDQIAVSIFDRTAMPWFMFFRAADTVMKLSVIEVTPGVLLKALLMAGMASWDVLDALDHAELLADRVIPVAEGLVIAALEGLKCRSDDPVGLGSRAAGHVFAVQEVFEVLGSDASCIDSGHLDLGRLWTEGDNLRLVLVVWVVRSAILVLLVFILKRFYSSV